MRVLNVTRIAQSSGYGGGCYRFCLGGGFSVEASMSCYREFAKG